MREWVRKNWLVLVTALLLGSGAWFGSRIVSHLITDHNDLHALIQVELARRQQLMQAPGGGS